MVPAVPVFGSAGSFDLGKVRCFCAAYIERGTFADKSLRKIEANFWDIVGHLQGSKPKNV